MKKLKLLIALAVVMALSIGMLTACNGYVYHNVTWSGEAVVATVDGEIVASSGGIREGSTVLFSWSSPNEGFQMRIVIGENAPQYRLRNITAFTHSVTESVIITFSIVAIPADCDNCNDIGCVECDPFFNYDCRQCKDVGCIECDPCHVNCDFGNNPYCRTICQNCDNIFFCGIDGCISCLMNFVEVTYHGLKEMQLQATMAVGADHHTIIIPSFYGEFDQHIWWQGIGSVLLMFFLTEEEAVAAQSPGDIRVDNVLIAVENAFSEWFFPNLIKYGIPPVLVDPENPTLVNPSHYNFLMDAVLGLQVLGLHSDMAPFSHAFALGLQLGQEFDGELARFNVWLFGCDNWAKVSKNMPIRDMGYSVVQLTHTYRGMAFGGNPAILDFFRSFIEAEYCLLGNPPCTCVGQQVLVSQDVFIMDGIGDFWITVNGNFPMTNDRFAVGSVVEIEVEVEPRFIVQIYVSGEGITTLRRGFHELTQTVGDSPVIILFRSFTYAEYLYGRFGGVGWNIFIGTDDFGGEVNETVIAETGDDNVRLHAFSSSQRATGIKQSILKDLGVLNRVDTYVVNYEHLVFWGTQLAVRQTLMFMGVIESSLHLHMTKVTPYQLQFNHLTPWFQYILFEMSPNANIFYLWPEFNFIFEKYGYYEFVVESFSAFFEGSEISVIKFENPEILEHFVQYFAVSSLLWFWNLHIAISECNLIMFFAQYEANTERLINRFGGRRFFPRIELDELQELFDLMQGLNLPESQLVFEPFHMRGNAWGWPAIAPYFIEGFRFFSYCQAGQGHYRAYMWAFMLDCKYATYDFAVYLSSVYYVFVCDCCEHIILFAMPTIRWNDWANPLQFIETECLCLDICECVFLHFGFSQIEIPFSAIGDWETHLILYDNIGLFSSVTIHVYDGHLVWRQNGLPIRRAYVNMNYLHPADYMSRPLVWNWIADGHAPVNAVISINWSNWLSIIVTGIPGAGGGAGQMIIANFVMFDGWFHTSIPCPICNTEFCVCHITSPCGQNPCVCNQNGEEGIPLNINTAGMPDGTIVGIEGNITNSIPIGTTRLEINIFVPVGYVLVEVIINETTFTRNGTPQFNQGISIPTGNGYWLIFNIPSNTTAVNISLVMKPA
ncbi:MAG: hypothetical protein FWC11_03505 [Firmicutes bacterium]|nr:hypothetical protein [Bacillota bacterium]MCL2255907.1 hypothetical protein [Bacillota bacterium]